MKVFTLITVFVAFACLSGFSQASAEKTTGTPAATNIIDKVKPHNPDATIYTIDFEDEVEWTFDFLPWTVNDVDGLDTYGFANYDFPHEYEAMAFIVFNPATTTPPLTGDPDIQPHSGAQFGACMASVPSGGQGNDDWFISDLIQIGTDSKGASFTFWAKTYDDTWGLERFNVGVSTTGNDPADFEIISGASYIEAPITWTEYTYDLSNYAGQDIYVAIQCVSYDAFVFMIDDLVIDPGYIPQDCDYFDTYTAGQLLCPQSNGVWTTWDDDPGGPYDGYVTDIVNLTPPNCLAIDLAVLESDLVYNLFQTTTGVWDVSLDILVPTGGSYGGYYNVMQDMVLFGASNEWGIELFFASDGTGYMFDDDGNQTDFTYNVGSWVHSSLIVDLDNNLAELWLDGVQVNTWQWAVMGINMLGVIDIYAHAPTGDDPFYFIDNVCFEPVAVGIDPVAAGHPGVYLHPNPVTDLLTITSTNQLLHVQLVNSVGQVVYTSQAAGNTLQIHTGNLETGLYFARVKTGNGYETKKFMKQ